MGRTQECSVSHTGQLLSAKRMSFRLNVNEYHSDQTLNFKGVRAEREDRILKN